MRVTLPEVPRLGVTPRTGKGALGIWWPTSRDRARTRPGPPGTTSRQAGDHGGERRGPKGNRRGGAIPTYRRPSPGMCPARRGEEAGKSSARGVYASQRLSVRTDGQARTLISGVQSQGQNRTREVPTVRDLGAALRTGFENRGQRCLRRAGARAQFRARQPHARVERGKGKRARRAPHPDYR